MGFTTQIFTFAFLPLATLIYFPTYFLSEKFRFLKRIRATDIILIALSLVFYGWACFDDIFRLCFYIVAVWIMGIILSKTRENGKKTALVLMLSFCGVLAAVLFVFKYLGFAADIVNFVVGTSLKPKSIMAMLGISFITFSAVSYIVDIYKGKAEAGNLIDAALYLTFFPKVVSGPIVLYRDFKSEKPEVTLTNLSDGITRVMIGFAKKVILADSFGLVLSKAAYAVDVPTAWGMGFLYMLQIYYDFSGYSDIALGLSKMLGYNFAENFNFPYLSTSITEFWRRWHISLGTWFREYIYFPLGGSRCGKGRIIFNISVVFLITGIWHGAGLTYIIWGMINGICNIIEKLISDKKIYIKTPKFIKWFFTMGVTFVCWQFFRAPSIRAAGRYILSMFGLMNFDSIVYTSQYYFDKQIMVFVVIAALGATVFGLPSVQTFYKKCLTTKTGYLINQLIISILFVLAILFMINSTYSPFLYFQY